MNAKWYYAEQGNRVGPLDWREIERLHGGGAIGPKTLVWRQGMPDWQPLGSVIASVAPQPPPLSPPPAPPASSPSPTTSRRRPPPNQLNMSWSAAIALLLIVAMTTAGIGAAVATFFMQRPHPAPENTIVQRPVERTQGRREANPSAVVDPLTVEPLVERPIDLSRTPVELPSVETPISVDPTQPDDSEFTPPDSDLQPEPAPAPEPEPQPPVELPQKVAWPWEGSQLFQEVNVRRKPTFNMLGRPVEMSQAYQILSTLDIGKSKDDGTIPITQTVIETRLHSADKLSRTGMQADLSDLKGRQFTYRFHPGHGVLDFHREGAEIKPADVKTDSLEGLFAGSAMDDDGWRELAHLTFLQPPEPLEQGVAWRRQIFHNWGSLGEWAGDTDFRYEGQRQNSDWIAYQHTMKWKPPAEGAGASMLKISAARFAATKSAGMIQYDPEQKRVLAAEESFEVGGAMQAEFAGQEIPIEMTELQTMGIRVLDQNPWRQ